MQRLEENNKLTAQINTELEEERAKRKEDLQCLEEGSGLNAQLAAQLEENHASIARIGAELEEEKAKCKENLQRLEEGGQLNLPCASV